MKEELCRFESLKLNPSELKPVEWTSLVTDYFGTPIRHMGFQMTQILVRGGFSSQEDFFTLPARLSYENSNTDPISGNSQYF